MTANGTIKILFLGDIVGRPGRSLVRHYLLQRSREQSSPDLIIANAENAAHGFGITEKIVKELLDAGVHVLSGGNHTFDKKETIQFIDDYPRVLRPANYPPGTPGAGACTVQVGEYKIAVISLLGRVFMEPLESPFLKADQLIDGFQDGCDAILVDLHAEATAEKIAFGWYVDGRVAAVLGTHTHVQTADERILPGGCAYITDVGFCGPRDGVIGMDQASVFQRIVRQLPTRFEIASGPAMVNGVDLTIDCKTGKALEISRICFHEDESK